MKDEFPDFHIVTSDVIPTHDNVESLSAMFEVVIGSKIRGADGR
jgi:hypothetical protein